MKIFGCLISENFFIVATWQLKNLVVATWWYHPEIHCHLLSNSKSNHWYLRWSNQDLPESSVVGDQVRLLETFEFTSLMVKAIVTIIVCKHEITILQFVFISSWGNSLTIIVSNKCCSIVKYIGISSTSISTRS